MTDCEAMKGFLQERIGLLMKQLDLVSSISGRGFEVVNLGGILQGYEIVTRDYSLADEVNIRYVKKQDTGNPTKTWFIDFVHHASTPHGVIPVYCRHWNESPDSNGIAQFYGISDAEMKRHDIDSVIEFYGQKKVKPELLKKLKHEMEHLYLNLPKGVKVVQYVD